jgi:hypothetical protein
LRALSLKLDGCSSIKENNRMNWTELSIVVNHEVEPLVTDILENYGSNGSIDSPFNSANSLIISFCLSVSFVGVTTLILTNKYFKDRARKFFKGE